MESIMMDIENLIFECNKCGNKYGVKELYKELNVNSIFQFEYEYECKNCNNNSFNIQFEYIPRDY